MVKIYSKYFVLIIAGSFLITIVTSCKKDNPKQPPPVTPTAKPLATIGLFEADSDIYKRIYIPITKVGTQNVNYASVFDTGSTGMTIDATGLIPAKMITSSGFVIPNDSLNVNGITITSQQAIIAYGNAQSSIQEFGNLAYANVTIGVADGSGGGTITTTRIPIFLYYKIVDVSTGKTQLPHSNDVFGVGPGTSFANSLIGSPLSYFKTGANVTQGFKLAVLPASSFSFNPTYVANLLTIGLVPADIASGSGFVMHQLTYFSQGGYSPDIPATITYSGKSIPATILFDTGTPAISIIENSTATSNSSPLPDGVDVTLTTSNGFTYSYTSSGTDDPTQVARPSFTGDPRTIFSINFFTENEFLMDYANHKIGLKNN